MRFQSDQSKLYKAHSFNYGIFLECTRKIGQAHGFSKLCSVEVALCNRLYEPPPYLCKNMSETGDDSIFSNRGHRLLETLTKLVQYFPARTEHTMPRNIEAQLFGVGFSSDCVCIYTILQLQPARIGQITRWTKTYSESDRLTD